MTVYHERSLTRSLLGTQEGRVVHDLASEASRTLAEAWALRSSLHEPGRRELHRGLLESAVAQAERALAALQVTSREPEAGVEASRALIGALHLTLVRAHAARAQDALHGAGQLSLSAQRAPTREACEDGWQRVEAIVRVAEASASAAASSASELESCALRPKARLDVGVAARRAAHAALAARAIVQERNHAYTFHTDGRFSFGEGWYLAAAALLAGVTIQVEPDTEGTAQAEHFLFAAGLRDRCQPYRSRPRAMKHTTHLIAEAFRADATEAQRRLRASFLGDSAIAAPLSRWIDRKLTGAPEGKKVLVWVRDGAHHPRRNSDGEELRLLARCVIEAGLVPVLTGDALREGPVPEGAVDLTLFWRDPMFCGLDKRRAQLQFFEHLRVRHGLVGQLGVTTAGMDGPALLGLRTLYLTDASNVRMREWVGAVPGYREVVRERGYLERVRRHVSVWARG